tara:strand:- start:412 stop:660 length:249 start_codon:yes stop_codon:yes gene_type:complete
MSWKKIVKIEDYDTLSYLTRESLDSLKDLERQLFETIYKLQSSKLGSNLRDKPESNLDFQFLLAFNRQLRELLSDIEKEKIK